jgi:hypothetical protein
MVVMRWFPSASLAKNRKSFRLGLFLVTAGGLARDRQFSYLSGLLESFHKFYRVMGDTSKPPSAARAAATSRALPRFPQGENPLVLEWLKGLSPGHPLMVKWEG